MSVLQDWQVDAAPPSRIIPSLRPEHPISEKSDPPHAVVLLDSPTAMEAGSQSCFSPSQDSLGDLNRGWSFAIANSSTLL